MMRRIFFNGCCQIDLACCSPTRKFHKLSVVSHTSNISICSRPRTGSWPFLFHLSLSVDQSNLKHFGDLNSCIIIHCFVNSRLRSHCDQLCAVQQLAHPPTGDSFVILRSEKIQPDYHGFEKREVPLQSDQKMLMLRSANSEIAK